MPFQGRGEVGELDLCLASNLSDAFGRGTSRRKGPVWVNIFNCRCKFAQLMMLIAVNGCCERCERLLVNKMRYGYSCWIEGVLTFTAYYVVFV